MKLIIDAGNTNIKIGYYQKNKQINFVNFPKENIDKISLPKVNEKISLVAIGSVIPSFNERISKKIYKIYKIKPIIISNKMFTKHFDLKKFDLNEIGTDILGLALYLKVNYKKAMAISFGTAIFSVAVNNKQIYGVMIAPDFLSALDDLNKLTELTRTNDFNQNKKLHNWFKFGNNTPKALAAGINHLSKGFIDNMYDYAKKEIKVNKLYVCGGRSKEIYFLNSKEYSKKIITLSDPIIEGYYYLVKSL